MRKIGIIQNKKEKDDNIYGYYMNLMKMLCLIDVR